MDSIDPVRPIPHHPIPTRNKAGSPTRKAPKACGPRTPEDGSATMDFSQVSRDIPTAVPALKERTFECAKPPNKYPLG